MDTGVSVTALTPTCLFTGPEEDPAQVVRVGVRRTRPAGPLVVRVEGPAVTTPVPRLLRADAAEAYAVVDGEADATGGTPGSGARPELADTVEVSVALLPGADATPGARHPVTARVGTPYGLELASLEGELLVAEPGWTLRLVPHFHYDPMWWNTQAAYTARWDVPPGPGETEKGWEYTGVPAFTLVPLHLQAARDDPAYRFVLSEIDYLKPFWDSHPQYRDELRQLIRTGRLEIVGGTYNEPSTNLTGAETTVRSALHGLAFHEGVLGARPRTAWQLDVFGHDPSFPALMAGAGLDSAVLARGPHHQWGPMMDTWGPAARPPDAMQLPAEYEWLSPGGEGLLLHYLPAHYSAGWFSHLAAGREEAAEQIVELYGLLRRAAATKNVLVPMGTDFSWPHEWGTEVQHLLARRYTWPRVLHTGPAEHFAAVRAELTARVERPLPVTREMGPVYSGKDVSYADVKQAQRAAENALQQAETFTALARSAAGHAVPRDALDKAWRHLLHAAHHDGVTGTFSDQVYLDLLPTWREAYELAVRVREGALRALAGRIDTRVPGAGGGAEDVETAAAETADAETAEPRERALAVPTLAVTVFNPLSWERTDLVRVQVELAPLGVRDARLIGLRDAAGRLSPVHVEAAEAERATVSFVARDVPALGHRTWWLTGCGTPLSGGWKAQDPAEPYAIGNAHYRVTADPLRGGGPASVVELRSGRELLTGGGVCELVVQDEYAAHPYFGEGPWHLLPKGPGTGSGAAPADDVRVERGPLGSRIVARGRTGEVRWRLTSTLWNDLDRLELTTDVEEFTGSDQLLRLRVPADVPGALPVGGTAAAVVGRGFAFPDADAGADHTRAPWTLDTPCLDFFALSSVCRAELSAPDGSAAGVRAFGAAEIVLPDAGLPGYGRPQEKEQAQEAGADGLRALVTALGRAGATSAPTRATGPRWGDIAVDSSLPDLRIAVGGPEENAFTAQVLASAHPAYAEAVAGAVKGCDGPYALVWVPARQALRAAWTPGLDLTGARDLCVAVLLAPDDDAMAALSALASDLARDGRIRAVHPVPDERADEHGEFEDRTVGVLVRGTPGFAVDTGGRLHSSLLRSSTGRPSGAWMDPPRRTAPDGSSFQLQHWTHRFEHALVAGDGDWRRVDLVRRGREFNSPLTAFAASPAEGGLRDGQSLLTVEPAERLLVESVKVGGPGQDSLVVRLHETHGAPARPVFSGPVARGTARMSDLRERPVDGPVRDVNGHATATVLFPLPAGPGAESAHEAHEVHQPVFSRYWLHNTGTAPLGDAPLSITVTPDELPCAGAPLNVQVTVSANRAPGGAPVTAALRVSAPDGWQVSWEECEVSLASDGHVSCPLRIEVPRSARPGTHLVRVEARASAGAPASASVPASPASVEDCLRVTVADPDGNGVPAAALTLVNTTEHIDVAPGGRTALRFRLGNPLRSGVRGEILALSPYGAWELTSSRSVPVTVGPDSDEEVTLTVRPPLDTPPGTYWVAAKAACDGLVAYSPAVRVRVAPLS
ncbi:NEW3 domain-containing protein [Streptomyces sp. NPDC050504]|uniref:glycoside hydrolase family 38 N-terminal domain-containing protein n=1 Tax=Streptomyces sp. NPDC050504 TaxID=3365618 RepID=UPI0037A2321C